MATHSAPYRDKSSRVPVLIVDDHALIRSEIRSMLEGHADIHIVGEASNGYEAIALVQQLHPHIVLMDINMPGMNGIEATAQIRSRYPDIIIIGLSVNGNAPYQTIMKRAGAARLLLKDEAPERLYDVIHDAMKSQERS